MMKKTLRLVVTVCSLCLILAVPAYAAFDANQSVGILIDDVDGHLIDDSEFALEASDRASSSIDLSNGADSFIVGTLGANATYKTNTYKSSNGRIKILLESYSKASNHIKITLYKSTGTSVAEATLSVPASNPAGTGGAKSVTFTNLSATTNYYAVIKNIDTVESGSLIGLAKKG